MDHTQFCFYEIIPFELFSKVYYKEINNNFFFNIFLNFLKIKLNLEPYQMGIQIHIVFPYRIAFLNIIFARFIIYFLKVAFYLHIPYREKKSFLLFIIKKIYKKFKICILIYRFKFSRLFIFSYTGEPINFKKIIKPVKILYLENFKNPIPLIYATLYSKEEAILKGFFINISERINFFRKSPIFKLKFRKNPISSITDLYFPGNSYNEDFCYLIFSTSDEYHIFSIIMDFTANHIFFAESTEKKQYLVVPVKKVFLKKIKTIHYSDCFYRELIKPIPEI